jgi:rubrerythrin
MNLIEALDEALAYETKIHDLYVSAAAEAALPESKAFFEFLARDEGYHVKFIESARDGARKGQAPDSSGLKTAIPADVSAAVAKAKAAFVSSRDGGQLSALENALRAEEETSAFYRRLVATLPASETGAFRRLQEIEDGHTVIVKAELDSVTRAGFWFDVREFDMEE